MSVSLFKQDPSIVNGLGVAFDGLATVVPFLPGGFGIIKSVGNVADAAGDAKKGLSQRAATREAKRQAGIPTSQQAVSQQSAIIGGNKIGRQQTFGVAKPGGGTQLKSVQVSRDVRGKHAGKSQVEAGNIKSGGQMDAAGRPRIENPGKVRVDF